MYCLYLQYSNDTEGFKRDFLKSESLLRNGIQMIDKIDQHHTEILLKEYIKFSRRMIDRIERDVYNKLSRDAWVDWILSRTNLNSGSWNEYENYMNVREIT